MCVLVSKLLYDGGNIVIKTYYSLKKRDILYIYVLFGLSWVPITMALSGVSNFSADMSRRDMSTSKYEQAEKRLYEV